MFKFKGKSPNEQFGNLVKIWILVCVLTLVSVVAGIQLDKPYTEKRSYDATLVNAYSTYKNCGHKGRYECEVFKGRFKVSADGKYYEREIDGFFYNNYIEKGKVDMPAYITLSKNDMGVQSPGYIIFMLGTGAVFFIVFIAGGLMLLLGGIEVEYSQREWERLRAMEARLDNRRTW